MEDLSMLMLLVSEIMPEEEIEVAKEVSVEDKVDLEVEEVSVIMPLDPPLSI